MKIKVIFFLTLTFIISWIAWGIIAILTHLDLAQFGDTTVMIGFVIGGTSPAISAFVTKRKFDKEQFHDFLKQHIKFKVNIGWYFWLILMPYILTGIPWFLNFLSTGKTEPIFNQPLYMVLAFLPMMIIGGGLEEIGWRGLLLPELLKKQSKFFASLIVGVIWVIWHFPLWFVKDSPQADLNLGLFAITVISMSYLFTILWETRSIGMCILFHAFFNSYGTTMNTPSINPWLDNIIKLILCISIFFLFRLADKRNSINQKE